MTLFEAIRELKEGQQIRRHPGGERFAYWAWGAGRAFFADDISWNEWDTDVRIIDLPKPKMTLEEGLEKVERDVFVEAAETDTGTVLYALWSKQPSISKAILSKLRSLPIDWQAEADRKKGK